MQSIHLCFARSRYALHGLRSGSNPLKSQSKRPLGTEIRSRLSEGIPKAKIHGLSTVGENAWTAYPIANHSNRGVAIYLLDIVMVSKRASYVREESYLCNGDFSTVNGQKPRLTHASPKTNGPSLLPRKATLPDNTN